MFKIAGEDTQISLLIITVIGKYKREAHDFLIFPIARG